MNGKSVAGENNENTRKIIDLQHFSMRHGEDDIYLDAGQGIFKLRVVGVPGENKEIYIEGLGNTGNDEWWVPNLLFDGYRPNQEMRACGIDSECYGKKIVVQWQIDNESSTTKLLL